MHSLAKCLKVWEKDERNENNNNNQNTARNLFRAYFFSVVVAVVCLLIFFVSYKMECKMQLIPTKKREKNAVANCETNEQENEPQIHQSKIIVLLYLQQKTFFHVGTHKTEAKMMPANVSGERAHQNTPWNKWPCVFVCCWLWPKHITRKECNFLCDYTVI